MNWRLENKNDVNVKMGKALIAEISFHGSDPSPNTLRWLMKLTCFALGALKKSRIDFKVYLT
jgi:hypothetical protein